MAEGITVLSLFDGISCGRIALERADIKVDKYYASEIKKIAIETTMLHYPDTVQIGDVFSIMRSLISHKLVHNGWTSC